MIRSSDPFAQPSVHEVLQGYESETQHVSPCEVCRTRMSPSLSGTPENEIVQTSISSINGDRLMRMFSLSNNTEDKSSSSDHSRSSSRSSNITQKGAYHLFHHPTEGNYKYSVFNRIKKILTQSWDMGLHTFEEDCMRNEPYLEGGCGQNTCEKGNSYSRSKDVQKGISGAVVGANSSLCYTADAEEMSCADRAVLGAKKPHYLRGKVAKELALEEATKRKRLQEDCWIVMSDIGRTYRGMVRNTTTSVKKAKALQHSLSLLEKKMIKQLHLIEEEWRNEFMFLCDTFQARMVAKAKREKRVIRMT